MLRHNMPSVEVCCFPSHTTHVLKLADKSLFRSLKHHWHEEVLHLARSGGRQLAKMDFFHVFTPALENACTVENAQADLRGTGIFHFNPKAIQHEVFAPCLITDNDVQPLQDTVTLNNDEFNHNKLLLH